MNRDSGSQNLSALQRLDNKIHSVLGSSGHVSAYIFDHGTKQWARKEVEGSLFVVSRTEYPYAKFIVMNRLSTKNLVEDVTEKLVIKCQGTYLIYKNTTDEINGIWFYETEDQDKIFKLLKDIQANPPHPQQHQQQQPPQHPQQPPPGMIPPPGFTMVGPPFIHHHPMMQQPHHPMMQQPPQPHHPIHSQQPHHIPQQQQQSNEPVNSQNTVPLMLAQIMNSAKPNGNNNNLNENENGSASSSNSNNNNISTKITKEQLKKKLKELINDEQFIDLIYHYYNQE